MFFTQKSVDVHIWRSLLARKISALDKPPSDCGRLLRTAPYDACFSAITWCSTICNIDYILKSVINII